MFGRLRRLGVAPAIVDEEVIDAIRERRFEIVPGGSSRPTPGALASPVANGSSRTPA